MLHATPAASEGVIDTRGIVPPAIPRYFFSQIFPLKLISPNNEITHLLSSNLTLETYKLKGHR